MTVAGISCRTLQEPSHIDPARIELFGFCSSYFLGDPGELAEQGVNLTRNPGARTEDTTADVKQQDESLVLWDHAGFLL